MSKFPSVTGKQVIAALKKAGFVVERQKGSHISYGKFMECFLEKFSTCDVISVIADQIATSKWAYYCGTDSRWRNDRTWAVDQDIERC